tara:strand:+ start:26 stop:472 length:447 start_codon:yes stop_codon:yes gene_type:complete
MNQEIPLSGGDTITNAVRGQWVVVDIILVAIGEGNNVYAMVKSRNINIKNRGSYNMAEFWKEPKDTGASDRYSLTIDPEWLDGETVLTATWSVAVGSGLTSSDDLILDNVVSSLFANGVTGNWCVEAEITTATRTKTFCATMVVRDCC